MPVALFVMKTMLDVLDERFAEVHSRSVSLIQTLDDRDLFRKPPELANSMTIFSSGEYILRSAATVEQTAGGIMTRLWDDPFEWTLPEKLSTVDLVIEHLHEVENTRQRAFSFIDSDEVLVRQIQAPDNLRTIFDVLLRSLSHAENYQGRAFAISQMMSDAKLPRL
jgi:hypothetical protein